eukprot:comp17317_c0_seq1/m.29051 comp17317_c0_seq1/g.29051  ORF comp17317_c0_seq1/g.29051 comp17317_c0_seq1/m.29051 type:complete len:293 (+) comp17317_c0_seq1:2-880(+)
MIKRVGFIGLGQMGERMAKNLVASGFSLLVHDLNAAAVTRLVGAGAVAAKDFNHIAAEAEAIVTMLPSSPNVTEVYEKLTPLLRSSTLCIDTSTIDPNIARQVNKKVSGRGVEMVDAPVSGGVTGAEKATLTFMVGGEAAAVARATPVLQKMGKNIVHCGAAGTGQTAKICNNLLLGISMIGVSEALNLGVKLGIDPKVLSNVINTSSGRCWSSDSYNPCPGVMDAVPASKNYEGGFATQLMAKDLGLASDAAEVVGASLPLGKKAKDIYLALEKNKDFGIIFKALADGKKF